LDGDSPLTRIRGEADDFAISGLFNRLAGLLFRFGENAAPAPAIAWTGRVDGGRRRTWRDLRWPKDILTEF
jgi:hypothetical protein